ncbi:hypothetical protein QC764_0047390 [Podospora pseudoanserina]|uniref:Protein kinase domain-containing protein n=1 Tax=Podospora pseudoanserina TaxID=2609844 RepID=A0ABR0IBA5_9PEZI|nr:hypothetical protein QC764_0047390 [Podospora pseudoanserina]
MEDDEDYEIKDIQFGFRRFRAPAKRIYANRNVFLLDIPPNPIACWLLFWMPQLASFWLQRLLPKWFLPTTVILKERNPSKADNYENEIDTYLHLQPLQGNHIPFLFGEVAVSYAKRRYQISQRPTPAILLEYIKGVSLSNLPTEELESPHLLEELKDMYNLLTKNGVVHGDPRLHNFLRVNNRIVPIDFEFSYPLPNDITNEDELETLKGEIEKLVRQAKGVKMEHLVSGPVIVNGLRVRKPSGTTTHN